MAEELTIERQAADLAMRFIGNGEYIKERRESLAANILELVSTIRRDTWDEAMEIANTCLQSHSPVKDDNGDIVNHGNSASCIYFALEAARELSHEQRTK